VPPNHVQLDEEELRALYETEGVLPCYGISQIEKNGTRYACPLTLKYRETSTIQIAQMSRTKLDCIYAFIGGWDGVNLPHAYACAQCFQLGLELREVFEPEYLEEE